MIDERELYERAIVRGPPPEPALERLGRRRDGKRRTRRVTATVVAIGIFAAVIAYFGGSVGIRSVTPARPTPPTPPPLGHNGDIAVLADVIRGGRYVRSHDVAIVDPATGRI